MNHTDAIKFDYYYGIEAEQFSFYRVPRLLIKDKRFKGLSSDAKLLYGLMLDRMSLSLKNGWLDDENRAYIIYTVDDIMGDLGCAKGTCVKIMKELDSENGIGLIEKKRRGLGKPDIIYVMNFSTIADEQVDDKATEEQSDNTGESMEKKVDNADEFKEVQNLNFKKSNEQNSRSSEIELPEVQNLNFRRFKNWTSVGSEIEPQEVQNLDPSYTNISYTDNSYIDNNYINNNYINNINNNINNNSINQSDYEIVDEIDMMDYATVYREIIKENIDYDIVMSGDNWNDKALYNELFELICEVVCMKQETVQIGRKNYPYELVKARFLKLNQSHLEYVINSIRNTPNKISNIKAYMLTALFNAFSTIGHYYMQKVQCDLHNQAMSDIQ